MVTSSAILLLLFILPAQAEDKPAIAQLAWGGGGAFTSTTEFDGTMYLASDVTGVWKQVDSQWHPFVEGLGNYNVTALVSFNKLLFAITTDELFVTNGTKPWRSTQVKLDTYRSITDQPYAIAADGTLLCIASRDSKINCIDIHNHLVSHSVPVEVVNGIYFSANVSDGLLFYSGKTLFNLDLAESKSIKIHTFNEKIVSIAPYLTRTLIATTKRIVDLTSVQSEIYQVWMTDIVNFFVANQADKPKMFVGTGSRWKQKLAELELVDNTLHTRQNITPQFESALPHRPHQQNLTKFLSTFESSGSIWLTDYWGVYRLDGDKLFNLIEVTNNAVNTVATDLVVTKKAIYVSTMDNGIIKFSKSSGHPKPEYQALAFDKLKGHSWSLLHHNQTVYGVISPWNNPNDFLFSYVEDTEKSSVSALTDYDNRDGKGTFWGSSFARKLVYFNGVLSFRDGDKGGLVKAKGNTFESDEPERLGHLNKVYKALAVHNDLLYMASCEGKPRILALDHAGSLKVLENLPYGFCPFNLYSHQDSLYLLGSRKGQSVIYQLAPNDFGVLLSTQKGSAFYQMAINPNNPQQIIAATISWSPKATSALFVSEDGGKSFVDKSNVLSHKNGVVAIRYDDQMVYILQKVGGLLSISSCALFSINKCKNYAQE